MRVHTNLTYALCRYRVLGDVTPEGGVEILSVELQTAEGLLLTLPKEWVRMLSIKAQDAIKKALRDALEAYHMRSRRLTPVDTRNPTSPTLVVVPKGESND